MSEGFWFEAGRWLFHVGLVIAVLVVLGAIVYVREWLQDRRRKRGER